MNSYKINVSVQIPGDLSDAADCIELFKELGGSECLEKTEIKRVVKSRHEEEQKVFSKVTKEAGDVLTHDNVINFTLNIPLTIDKESVFRGYYVTPMKIVAKYFDEFTQCIKKPSYNWVDSYKQLEGIEGAEPILEQHMLKFAFYDINDKSYNGVWENTRPKWQKDNDVK